MIVSQRHSSSITTNHLRPLVLPATILTLTVSSDHLPQFNYNCFRCYMSYWVRWDESLNRQVIHEIIDAFMAKLAQSKSGKGEKEEKKKKNKLKNRERRKKSGEEEEEKKKKKSEIKSCGWWFPKYVFNYENAMKIEFWKLKTPNH